MRCRKLWRKAHDQSFGAFVNCSILGIPGISDHLGIYLHDQPPIRNKSATFLNNGNNQPEVQSFDDLQHKNRNEETGD